MSEQVWRDYTETLERERNDLRARLAEYEQQLLWTADRRAEGINESNDLRARLAAETRAVEIMTQRYADANERLAVVEARKDAYREQTEMQATEIKKLIFELHSLRRDWSAREDDLLSTRNRLAAVEAEWREAAIKMGALVDAANEKTKAAVAERDQLRAELEKKNARDMAS